MREYFRRPTHSDYEWWDIPNLDSTTRTVIIDEVSYDTGIFDEAGNKIMAREKKEPAGFIRLR